MVRDDWDVINLANWFCTQIIISKSFFDLCRASLNWNITYISYLKIVLDRLSNVMITKDILMYFWVTKKDFCERKEYRSWLFYINNKIWQKKVYQRVTIPFTTMTLVKLAEYPSTLSWLPRKGVVLEVKTWM